MVTVFKLPAREVSKSSGCLSAIGDHLFLSRRRPWIRYTLTTRLYDMAHGFAGGISKDVKPAAPGWRIVREIQFNRDWRTAQNVRHSLRLHTDCTLRLRSERL